ncbi:hypothetical protein [Aminobacter sp. HY435]|uniref:hypothetical protein n=1 Tax=Aminobacter sp. HY435 TaxID=2970917 RepID=UPI0022B9B135|nr:hypothetical protein [Aminobacter sp. HY435]
MNFSTLSGHGYLFIGGLILVGAGLLIISLIFNLRVAHSVREDVRYREKLHEYYRNIFSQLGVILIGIGVSLFIFFFQQNYQDRRKREVELQQVYAKLALRVARGAAIAGSLDAFDELLDDGGAYRNPEDGGANRVVNASGEALANQVAKLLLVERDVDAGEFEVMNVSRDFEASFVANELDPVLWFNIVRDESDLRYATTQLALDYKDLHEAIGDQPIAMAMGDPERLARIKQEVLDIFYDADLLRQRSRKVLGRACWFYSKGLDFVALRPVAAIEADAKSQQDWLAMARPVLERSKSGNGDCYKLLHYDLPQSGG